MKIYIAERCGIYSQGIVFVSENFDKTKEAARIEILKEPDDYHRFSIYLVETDIHCHGKLKLMGTWERSDEYKIGVKKGRQYYVFDEKTGKRIVLKTSIKWIKDDETT